MKLFKIPILALLLLALGYLPSANANTMYRSKVGFDIKALRTNVNSNLGWLFGLRAERFLGKSQVHLGVAGYFGAPRGTNPSSDYITYGGLSLGYDGKFSRIFRYEISLVVGYGQGKITSGGLNIEEKSYLVGEPSFGTGFHLGKGWRVMFAASYLYMNNADNFSGPTFGIRFEYRKQTTIKSIDD